MLSRSLVGPRRENGEKQSSRPALRPCLRLSLLVYSSPELAPSRKKCDRRGETLATDAEEEAAGAFPISLAPFATSDASNILVGRREQLRLIASALQRGRGCAVGPCSICVLFVRLALSLVPFLQSLSCCRCEVHARYTRFARTLVRPSFSAPVPRSAPAPPRPCLAPRHHGARRAPEQSLGWRHSSPFPPAQERCARLARTRPSRQPRSHRPRLVVSYPDLARRHLGWGARQASEQSQQLAGPRCEPDRARRRRGEAFEDPQAG